MSIIRTLPAQFLNIDLRSTAEIEQEIIDELDFHIAMRTEEGLRTGLAPEAARESALARFGDFAAIHQRCRRALLGERIMWQRFQIGLSIVLLLAVGWLAFQLYASQQQNAEALANLQWSVKALSINPTEAQTMSAGPSTPQEDQTADWRLERPVVIETQPKNGDQEVDAASTEIRVKFNKPMADQSWSWVQISKSSFPETMGDIHYDIDSKTCVMPVKLEPGRKYIIWINSANFQDFKDGEGRPAEPYLLKFATAPVKTVQQ
jgi:Bacterial Ig-like domain